MNLTDTEILKFLKGSPVFLDDICAIYPAKVGEIVDLGYDTFQTYLSIINTEKPDIKESDSKLKEFLEPLSDFQYLLAMAEISLEINQALKDAFFFFTHENVFFSLNPAQIIIGPAEEKHLLTEEKFYEFRSIIRRMFFMDQDGDEIIINESDPPAVKQLKKQMRANRKKLKKAKAKRAAQEGTDVKFSDLIASVSINNCNLNIENIWNITYYAFFDQLRRSGWRDQFNINTEAALAGAKIKKNQLKHWVRSMSNSD